MPLLLVVVMSCTLRRCVVASLLQDSRHIEIETTRIAGSGACVCWISDAAVLAGRNLVGICMHSTVGCVTWQETRMLRSLDLGAKVFT